MRLIDDRGREGIFKRRSSIYRNQDKCMSVYKIPARPSRSQATAISISNATAAHSAAE